MIEEWMNKSKNEKKILLNEQMNKLKKIAIIFFSNWNHK